jgi:mono/diheme cytochrome c family protein
MKTATSSTSARRQALRFAAVALIAGAAVMGGCRGDRSGKPPRQFFPDLDDQPKMKAQTKNTFWTEFEGKKTAPDWGRTARLPVENTVPYGRAPHRSPVTGYRISEGEPVFRTVDFAKRESFLAFDTIANTGKRADSTLVERIPIPVDLELIELGRTKYEITCISCHGGTGKGDGVVGTRWAYPLPNFQEDQWQLGATDADGQPLETALDGHIFDIIRNGKVNEASPTGYAMPPYGGKLSVEESWAVVAYLRSLQATQRGTIDDLRRYNRSAADRLLQNISQPSGENQDGGEQ